MQRSICRKLVHQLTIVLLLASRLRLLTCVPPVQRGPWRRVRTGWFGGKDALILKVGDDHKLSVKPSLNCGNLAGVHLCAMCVRPGRAASGIFAKPRNLGSKTHVP